MDLHRPYVDEITFPHPRTGKTMRRVEEVIDCWFDSGAMPYAQWHYPFENAEVFKGAFPADFISEAVDQTRGWFYTLHAIATLVSDSVAYKNCVCLGHVVDADGAKMSKSKGNILNPWEVFDAQGADALRWFFLVGTPPGSSKRVSVELVAESVHGTFNTLWNTYAFFVMYANLDQPDLIGSVHSDQLEPIDRWILSRLNQTNLDVTRAMDGYDVQEAGRLLASFVDELSNWYVRLNRRRFWKGEDDRSKLSAYWTLYMSLRGSISMLAPIAPFLAEHMYQNLVRPIDEEASASVHTEDWPCADRSLIDESLMAEMSVVLQAISLGRAARIKAQAKVRQPLASAVVVAEDPASRDAIIRQSALIKDELNVKEVRVLESSNELVEHALRPNLPRLGPRLGKKLGLFRKLLTTLDPAPVVAALRLGGTYDMDLDGESVSLTQDDLLIDAKPAAGFHSAEGEGLVVSLDTRLTRELGLEGIARDVIRLIQESRKKHGLDVSDRIHLRLESSEDVTEAIKVHGVTISRETLAVSLNAEDIDQKEVVDYHGTNIVIGIRLVTD